MMLVLPAEEKRYEYPILSANLHHTAINVRFISLSDYIALLSVRLPIILYPIAYLSVCPNCVSVCLSAYLPAASHGVSLDTSIVSTTAYSVPNHTTRHRTTPPCVRYCTFTITIKIIAIPLQLQQI
jgi:hypothetical protein